MLNDIRLCVISNKRPQNVKNMETVCEPHKIYWYVGKKQKQEYENAGAYWVKDSGGLSDSRNQAIIDSQKEKKHCLQLDDDFKKVQFINKNKKGVDWELSKAIKEMSNYINNNMLVGVSPTNNAFYFNPKKPFSTKNFIIGSMCLINKKNKCRFDNNLKLKEDYDFTIENIYRYGSVLRMNYIMPTFQHYTNKGGAVETRNDETEKESIQKLFDKHGDKIRLNKKRKNEILMAL